MNSAEQRTTFVVADPSLIADWSPSDRRTGHSSSEAAYAVTKL